MAGLKQPDSSVAARSGDWQSQPVASAALEVRKAAPTMVFAAWGGAILLGAVSILADELLTAPSAARARSALLAIAAGDLRTAMSGLDALLTFFAAKFGAPLLLLAGLVAIDVRASGGVARGSWFEPAWLVRVVFLSVTTVALLAINEVAAWPEPLIRIEAERGTPAYWAMFVPLLLLTIFAVDLLAYWVHRAQHRFAFLWRFHAVHHSHQVDVLHNINHPVDVVTGYLLAVLPVAFLIQVNSAELLLIGAFFVVQTSLNHMRAPINLGPFGLLLSDNRYHFIHHSRDPADFNTNFAVRFPVIDMIFGTYRKPGSTLPETGLDDRGPPEGIRQHLLARWPEKQV